jgi:hypothetical protein
MMASGASMYAYNGCKDHVVRMDFRINRANSTCNRLVMDACVRH